MRPLILAAALLLSAPLHAQMISKIRVVGGGHGFEPEGSFTDRGSAWCGNGRFVDASVLPARREIRLVCSLYDRDGGRDKIEVQLLNADAKLSGTAKLVSTSTLGTVFDNVAWIERGKSEPLAVTWNSYQARVWDEKGQDHDLKTDGITAATTLGSKDGGPLFVVSHGWGANGVEAFRPDGRSAWATPEPAEVRGLESVRLDGKAALAAWYSVGRLALLDGSGKVRERVLPEGNSDRLMVEDGKEPRLFVLDSGANSGRERVKILSGRKDKGARVWTRTGGADLGPITVTAWTSGRFAPNGGVRAVVGTSNGWVFVLGEDGSPVASRKFLSPVHRLAAADLDGDGRDELVMILSGASENVYVASPGSMR